MTATSPQPALASEDDEWAYPTINKMRTDRGEEAQREERPARGSASANDPDDDGTRPQRKAQPARVNAPARSAAAPRKQRTRMASLGKEVSPPPRPSQQPAALQPPKPPDVAAPRPKLGPMVASLGHDLMVPPAPSDGPSISGGSPIRWVASAECLASALRGVLADVAAHFGPVMVNSTCRSRRHNARVGGAKRSYHLTGQAADFRVSGSANAVLAFLSGNRLVGGLKHYGFGLFHIDTGPRRTWGSRKRYRSRRG